jgi:hypothetical protein
MKQRTTFGLWHEQARSCCHEQSGATVLSYPCRANNTFHLAIALLYVLHARADGVLSALKAYYDDIW